jgi:hypothetical protein
MIKALAELNLSRINNPDNDPRDAVQNIDRDTPEDQLFKGR